MFKLDHTKRRLQARVRELEAERQRLRDAITLYDVWRRLPPKQRRQILEATRKHGPRVAARVMNGAKRAPRRPR